MFDTASKLHSGEWFRDLVISRLAQVEQIVDPEFNNLLEHLEDIESFELELALTNGNRSVDQIDLIEKAAAP